MRPGCTGPCQQGRLPCPTPDACQVEEPNFYSREHWREMGFDLGVVILVVMAVVAVAAAVVKGLA